MSDWRPVAGPLAAEQCGHLDSPRLAFVHGFAQTGNSWKPIAEYFANHGDLRFNGKMRSSGKALRGRPSR